MGITGLFKVGRAELLRRFIAHELETKTGHSDPEPWLNQQAGAKGPDDGPEALRLPQKRLEKMLQADGLISILEARAEPTLWGDLVDEASQHYGPHSRTMLHVLGVSTSGRRPHVKMYTITTPSIAEQYGVPVLLWVRDEFSSFLLELEKDDSGFFVLKEAGAFNVWQIVLDTWRRESHPFGNSARTFAHTIYVTLVLQLEDRARRDFQAAVAVSPDGTKVVQAGWVLIRPPGRPDEAKIVRGSRFRQHKIRLEPTSKTIRPRTVLPVDMDPDHALAHASTLYRREAGGWGAAKQALIKCKAPKGDDKGFSVLVTCPSLCPDLLPTSTP